MAFQTISVDNLTPTFFEMINQGALDAPVFAFYLETTGENGELSLGQMDPAHYTGPVQVVPLSSETYFEVQLDDLSINGQKVRGAHTRVCGFTAGIGGSVWDLGQRDSPRPGGAAASAGTGGWPRSRPHLTTLLHRATPLSSAPPAQVTSVNKAILDTGTSLLAGPTADVKALMTQLGATPFPLNPNEYTIDCTAVPKLPTLEIAIGGGGAKFSLNGTQYTLNVEGMCLMAFTVRDRFRLCRGGSGRHCTAFAGLCDATFEAARACCSLPASPRRRPFSSRRCVPAGHRRAGPHGPPLDPGRPLPEVGCCGCLRGRCACVECRARAAAHPAPSNAAAAKTSRSSRGEWALRLA
jgi:hypothetical protein